MTEHFAADEIATARDRVADNDARWLREQVHDHLAAWEATGTDKSEHPRLAAALLLAWDERENGLWDPLD